MAADALAKIRAQYPQYADIPDKELAQKLVTKYPQYKDMLGDVAKGEMGATRRDIPEAPDQPERPKVPEKPGELLRVGKMLIGKEQPEGFGDYAKMAVATAPLMWAGGALPAAGAARLALPKLAQGAASVLGEMGTAGGLGAVQSAGRGGDASSMAWSALLDATVAGLTRGALGAATGGAKIGPIKLGLKEWGGPARGFEFATKAPEDAIKALEGRIPKSLRFFEVPTLSDKPMAIGDAVRGLSKLEGVAYEKARREIASELSKMEFVSPMKQGFSAGREFLERTSDKRFAPSTMSEVAEGARKALSAPFTRAGIESMMVTPAPGTPVPLGALGLLPAVSGMAGKVPGLSEIAGERADLGRRFGGQ